VTFLLQVLSVEKTLRAAVSSLLVQLRSCGQTDLPSADPTGYCQARQRVPGSVLTDLSKDLAQQMSALPTKDGRWHGHRVRQVDGTTVSMPDTEPLQKEFPQPEAQKPGCGFPVARLVTLFCWATGAVLRCAIGNLRTSEIALLRRHSAEWLIPGDLLLADRHYCSYVDIARLNAIGVVVVFRLHARRPVDFRRGKRLGRDDQIVTWTRPEYWLPSFGVTPEEFEALPETLTLRQIRITTVPRGFRSRTIVVVTTLLDPIAYPADDIRALFRDRWTVELNLRAIKIALGMDVLRGQSPEVVRKEITMHLLAYNLIRLLMWRAARDHGKDLHRLSFTGTVHRLRTALPFFMALVGCSAARRTDLLNQLLKWIADDVLPDRPNRCEPRRKKRRPKQYSLLNKPRAWYRTHVDSGAR
jgi:hypothetical protein